MRECVPLRAALQGHCDHIVCAAQGAKFAHVRATINAGHEERVNRIESLVVFQHSLRTINIVVHRKPKGLPGAHQASRRCDHAAGYVVEGPQFVPGPPATPSPIALHRCVQIFDRQARASVSGLYHAAILRHS